MNSKQKTQNFYRLPRSKLPTSASRLHCYSFGITGIIQEFAIMPYTDTGHGSAWTLGSLRASLETRNLFHLCESNKRLGDNEIRCCCSCCSDCCCCGTPSAGCSHCCCSRSRPATLGMAIHTRSYQRTMAAKGVFVNRDLCNPPVWA